jgi:hypothetical protein
MSETNKVSWQGSLTSWVSKAASYQQPFYLTVIPDLFKVHLLTHRSRLTNQKEALLRLYDTHIGHGRGFSATKVTIAPSPPFC